MPDTDEKIVIESATSPGHTQRVDRSKYTVGPAKSAATPITQMPA